MEATEDFDRFYAAAFARLVGQLAVVTGDRHEAEDVVQEAMARASLQWARLRTYDAPEAWVRRVALNLAVAATGVPGGGWPRCFGSGHQRRSRRSRWTPWSWPKPSRG